MSVSKASFHLKCTNDFSYLISSLKPIKNNIYPFQLISSVKTLKKIKRKTTDKERAKKAPNEWNNFDFSLMALFSRYL